MINFFKNLLSNDPDSLSLKRFIMAVAFGVFVISYVVGQFTKYVPPDSLLTSLVYIIGIMGAGNAVEKFSSFFKSKNISPNNDVS